MRRSGRRTQTPFDELEGAEVVAVAVAQDDSVSRPDDSPMRQASPASVIHADSDLKADCWPPGCACAGGVLELEHQAGDAGLRPRRASVSSGDQKLIASRHGVVSEHLHRRERELVEVAAERPAACVRSSGVHGDDVAADLIGLHDVQHLARARPQEARGSA